MRRLLVAAALLATAVPTALAVSAGGYTPVCVTVQPGWGWYRVAAEFAPGVTGAARDAFISRMWGYEEEARITAGELVCIDPNDPALSSPQPSTTSSVPATTTSSTVSPSSTTTVSTSTTSLPPTGNGPLPNVPSNFNTATYIAPRPGVDESTAHEPTGNFRTLCRASHLAYDDPIVNPGTASAHLHLFFGNTAVNRNSTYESLRTTGDSTCEGGPINRTGYWMPAVFDGQGRVVPPDGIIVYYKATASGGTLAQQQTAIRSTQPLPNGLRMVAGAPGGHFNWRCENGSGLGSTIPNSCPGSEDLYATVSFPDCWNGRDLDSPDHRSHMAYRSYVNGIESCPASHPVRIPSISETFWWGDASDVGGWSLSSDMGAVDGSSFHADWFGAWDNPTMDRWFVNCLIGMEHSNNGYLCDGYGLTGARYAGTITSLARVPGWTPMQP